MSDAELTDDADTGSTDDVTSTDDGTVTLSVDGSEVSVSLPADADPAEAAAIATVVGAHLQDRAVAAAAAADDEGPEPADPWTLAGRLKAAGKRRWPDDVDRGEEWQAAARSY